MLTSHIVKCETNELILIPFGDVHRDSDCDVDRWLSFLKDAKKNHTKNTYYLGMGDYFDFVSTREMKKIQHADLHDSTICLLDKSVKKMCSAFVKEIEWMGSNLIGLIQGNHDWHLSDGITATQHMCDLLKCMWLGELTYIRFSIGGILHKSNASRAKFDIFAHHGKGSPSKLLGTSFNTVDSMNAIFPLADCIIQGHDHRKGALPNTYLQMEYANGILTPKQVQQVVCRSGSFLKGYVLGKKSYVASKLLRPTDLGTIKIICKFVRIRDTVNKIDSIVKDIHTYV